MKCYFDYCIYNKQFQCTLDEIEINGWGQCKDGIIVNIPEKQLKNLKNTHLYKRDMLNKN